MRDLKPETSLHFDEEHTPRRSQRDRTGGDRDRYFAYHDGALRPRVEFGKRETPPRPAWMDDPSLLPKRPPGSP